MATPSSNVAPNGNSDSQHRQVRHVFPDLWAMEERYGSLVMGVIKSNLQNMNKTRGPKQSTQQKTRSSFSFTGGLQTLAKALAENIGEDSIQLNTTLVELASKQQGNPGRDEWSISCSKNGSKSKSVGQHFDAVILTVPLHNLKQLRVTRGGKRFSFDFIPEVFYQPMSTFVTVFRTEDVKRPLKGFGVLIPAKAKAQGFETLGTLFSSSMFPDRVPQGQIMFTTFVGGRRNRDLASASVGELEKVVLKDLQKLVGVEGQPLSTKHFFWEKAFPEYNLEYSKVLGGIEKLENDFPGLFYAGNHRGGLAVGKTFVSGCQAAENVLRMLESSGGRIYTMAGSEQAIARV